MFAAPRGRPPLNVLSVTVLAEAVEGRPHTAAPVVLNSSRIRVDGFDAWSFGVARAIRPVSALGEALTLLAGGEGWAVSGKALAVGDLRAQPPSFVPPDGTEHVPVNRLLKNNFWSGSHLFRLTDSDKASFAPLLKDRRRLQLLSDSLAPYVPLRLAGLADFLGDVLIQVPVTVLVADVQTPRCSEEVEISVAWHPLAPSRHLRAAARMRADGMLTGAAVSDFLGTSVRLPVNGHLHAVEVEIWDAATGTVLAATTPTSTIRRVVIEPRLAISEPRLFTAPDALGSRVASRVELAEHLGQQVVGDAPEPDADHWQRRRNELEEARRLAETREFVQYRPVAGDRSERQRALEDIRKLIELHGDGGVDLWDPYLCADDLLQTLFWCPHAGVRLRALTDGRDPPTPKAPWLFSCGERQGPPPPPFADRQRKVLADDGGNLELLSLEYRTRRGTDGWTFHDRFLIFPNRQDGPAAWSLGTSVNSLGLAHHVLQRVSNAALIAGAFQDLWDALSRPEHVIWQSP